MSEFCTSGFIKRVKSCHRLTGFSVPRQKLHQPRSNLCQSPQRSLFSTGELKTKLRHHSLRRRCSALKLTVQSWRRRLKRRRRFLFLFHRRRSFTSIFSDLSVLMPNPPQCSMLEIKCYVGWQNGNVRDLWTTFWWTLKIWGEKTSKSLCLQTKPLTNTFLQSLMHSLN